MQKPILVHRSEASVLDQTERQDLVPFVIGGRSRMATCSGLSWIDNNHLAVVNLFGCHLRVYSVEEQMDAPGVALKLLHEHTDAIFYPENVAISRSGGQVAITHSQSERHGVSVQSIHHSDLKPGKVDMLRRGTGFHGADFSPDGHYLMITNVGEPGYVEVVKTAGGECVCRFDNRLAPLKPKDARFVGDTNLVVIAYGPNARRDASEIAGGMLCLHVCDLASGTVDPEPVSVWHDSNKITIALESCAVCRTPGSDRFMLLCADQGTDSLYSFSLDPASHAIEFQDTFSTDLSFPHSVAVDPDGRLAAVANYGDDTIRIFKVDSHRPKLNLRQRLRRLLPARISL